jgi:hypothetical protein
MNKKNKTNCNKKNDDQIGYKKQMKWYLYVFIKRREKRWRRRKKFIGTQPLCRHIHM